MQVNDALGDGQAEPCAPGASRTGLLHTREPLKDARYLILWDITTPTPSCAPYATPRITHLEPDVRPAALPHVHTAGSSPISLTYAWRATMK